MKFWDFPEELHWELLSAFLGNRGTVIGEDLGSFGHRVLICDFGNANAFSAFGVASGSRPYMAPEQYPPSQNSFSKADVFATGVILHELVSGGLHPIGERTRDVWPLPLAETMRSRFRLLAVCLRELSAIKQVLIARAIGYDEAKHVIGEVTPRWRTAMARA